MGFINNFSWLVFVTCFGQMVLQVFFELLSLWHFRCAFPPKASTWLRVRKSVVFAQWERGYGGPKIGGQVNRIPSEVLSGRCCSATVARCRERLSQSLLSSNVYWHRVCRPLNVCSCPLACSVEDGPEAWCAWEHSVREGVGGVVGRCGLKVTPWFIKGWWYGAIAHWLLTELWTGIVTVRSVLYLSGTKNPTKTPFHMNTFSKTLLKKWRA